MDIGANLGQQRLAGARARHRHRWVVTFDPLGKTLGTWVACAGCHVRRDEQKSRKGTSSRRLGHDQERRIERVYGPRKIGEFGDAIDLIGRDFMWQSKSTRLGAPSMSHPEGIWAAKSFAYVQRNIDAMLALRQDRAPLLIRSWVRQGVIPTDLIFVRGMDWTLLHGDDVPADARLDGYVAMTGQHFLDVHGRDEP